VTTFLLILCVSNIATALLAFRFYQISRDYRRAYVEQKAQILRALLVVGAVAAFAYLKHRKKK